MQSIFSQIFTIDTSYVAAEGDVFCEFDLWYTTVIGVLHMITNWTALLQHRTLHS